ncbi:MAG: hypothetical protein M3115_00235 [Thermoproteota archaeon]|nr:hypothetical protein [Thermoproteota archaeon]
MWSSVVLFVLTFAVLGLLLGFSAVYNANQEGQTGQGLALSGNSTGNATEMRPTSNNTGVNQESGQ